MGKYDGHIDAVRAAKQAYDRQVNQINARAAVERDAAKKPVLEAIQRATSAGASRNSVAIKGMGYAGLAPMVAFERTTTVVVPGYEEVPVVSAHEYTFTPDSTDPNSFKYFRKEDGKKLSFYHQEGTNMNPDRPEDVRSDFYAQFKATRRFSDQDVEQFDGGSK
jgi:hypothetical protein